MPTKSSKSPNKFITLFLVITTLTLALSGYRYLKRPSTPIYLKIKLSQGLWWLSQNSNSPPPWLLQNLLLEKDNKASSTKLIDLAYYPKNASKSFTENQEFDVYLTLIIFATHNPATNTYSYQRNPLAIGAPISLDLPSTVINGSIIAISDQPIEDSHKDITLKLTKQMANPWEYDAIQVGDVLNNGEEDVFEVLSKKKVPTNYLAQDSYGNLTPQTITPTSYIEITASMKVSQVEDYYIFAEEQIITPGNYLQLATPNFNYSYFQAAEIIN